LNKEEIIQKLPYSKPFLFVDEILQVDEATIKGCYTFKKDEYFYEGHFKNNPITPGVILTECMAQIGLACFGINLLKDRWEEKDWSVAMTQSEMLFYKPVFPNEKVSVMAEKIYFRFNKLKCNVKMINSQNIKVAEGVLAGMVFDKELQVG